MTVFSSSSFLSLPSSLSLLALCIIRRRWTKGLWNWNGADFFPSLRWFAYFRFAICCWIIKNAQSATVARNPCANETFSLKCPPKFYDFCPDDFVKLQMIEFKNDNWRWYFMHCALLFLLSTYFKDFIKTQHMKSPVIPSCSWHLISVIFPALWRGKRIEIKKRLETACRVFALRWTKIDRKMLEVAHENKGEKKRYHSRIPEIVYLRCQNVMVSPGNIEDCMIPRINHTQYSRLIHFGIICGCFQSCETLCCIEAPNPKHKINDNATSIIC